MRTAEDYGRQAAGIQPPGRVLPKEPGSTWRRLLDALAAPWAWIEQRAWNLAEETDPRTTVELLPEWERMAGLPGPCDELQPTLQLRRQALVQKLTTRGGASHDYFIAVAAQLGHDVEIAEQSPFRVESGHVGEPLSGDEVSFVWEVRSPEAVAISEFRVEENTVEDPLRSWGNELLECTLDDIKPAHTQVFFSYGSA